LKHHEAWLAAESENLMMQSAGTSGNKRTWGRESVISELLKKNGCSIPFLPDLSPVREQYFMVHGILLNLNLVLFYWLDVLLILWLIKGVE
jgi:hypothetical protein